MKSKTKNHLPQRVIASFFITLLVAFGLFAANPLHRENVK